MTDRRTFKPALRENEVKAGGLTLFVLDEDGRVVFEDRYLRRCVARGTPDVPVDLLELLGLVLEHYRNKF